jgi:hypothetical protein
MVKSVIPIRLEFQYAPKTDRREPQNCGSPPSSNQLASEQILKFNSIRDSPSSTAHYRVPEPWVITGGAVGSGTNLAIRSLDPVAVVADREKPLD